MSILKSYGYEESDQQRELLLADYTPPASLKLSRQLDIMMMMNGLGSKEQKTATDYIEGKIGREEIEHLAKKFILQHHQEPDTPSLATEDHPKSDAEKEVELVTETEGDNFRLVEKPTPQLLTKL